MDTRGLEKQSDFAWRIPRSGAMRVPAIIYADAGLMHDMDDKVREQAVNVATLPGIVGASYAMPDAHWGYGFPIGGVAAFDPDEGGVISAGGVGFDISCGVRTLLTGLKRTDVEPIKMELADALYAAVPAGLGSTGRISLSEGELNEMLEGGAAWAVAQGYGRESDLDRIEEHGKMKGARADYVSMRAKQRQRKEMGTLGSGNHYLELQEVARLFDEEAGRAFGLAEGDIVVTIHCGSRGLGHQIGTEFLREMAIEDARIGIRLPDRELACAPIRSPLGDRYLGAMRAGINCALANRQIITHLVRRALAGLLPEASLDLLFDVSHNTCKVEPHVIDGIERELYVHRKGATRAFGPGHDSLPSGLRAIGQPVFVGGSMGTTSWILVGTKESEARAFSSACHGAGRSMSRHQARRTWGGREIVENLARKGIIIRSPSLRGVAEEAPDAYKDVSVVIEATHRAGLAAKVAELRPVACIKG
jgi:tRNA-splicing ligase RtcB